MKRLLVIIAVILSSLGTTASAYNHPKFQWKMSEDLGQGITLKSVVQLSIVQVNLLRNTFDNTETRFFEYFKINRDSCEYGKLEIRVVADYAVLNDKAYFPGLDPASYANSNERIFGRYFRDENILYIIAPYSYVYDWRKDFAHELIHFFFDDCGRIAHGAKIMNNDEEHRFVDKFLDVHKSTFR